MPGTRIVIESLVTYVISVIGTIPLHSSICSNLYSKKVTLVVGEEWIQGSSPG